MTIDQIATMLTKPGFHIFHGKYKTTLDCPDSSLSVACGICVFANSNGRCTIIGKDTITDEQLAELQVSYPELLI
jgi:hypothetical protein